MTVQVDNVFMDVGRKCVIVVCFLVKKRSVACIWFWKEENTVVVIVC